MALPNYLTPKKKGWPHDKSWPKPSDRVEVEFDDGTILVCALSSVERA